MNILKLHFKKAIHRFLRKRHIEQKFINNCVQAQLKMDRVVNSEEMILVPELMAGFQLRYFEPGQEDSWFVVLNLSLEFGLWDSQRLSKFTSEMIPKGGVIVFNELNEPVACSALCLKKRFTPSAVLMNVIVLPSYRCLGISKVMLTDLIATSQSLAIPSITLLTDDFRLAAIGLYLQLGFRPDYSWSPDSGGRWEKVFAQLKDIKR